MKKMFLVDVSSMFFRAFYAIPPLQNSTGMPTNALYGFLSMTLKLLREMKPDYMAFCFDRPEPSFRSHIYPQYKANRKEIPSDLLPQLPYVRKITEILGIPIVEKETFEADDVIGTLTQLGQKEGLKVVIVSGDKDFAQLVSSSVSLYDTMKNMNYDPSGVKAKWGVLPEQMIDYLSLVGDTSDNVPGVKGIGPKGAIKLLADFHSLEGIYQNIDGVSGKSIKTKLIDNKDMAFLAKKLVTIVQDVPLSLSLTDLQIRPVDKEKLQDLLLQLDFKTFAKSIESGSSLNSSFASSSQAVGSVLAIPSLTHESMGDNEIKVQKNSQKKKTNKGKTSNKWKECQWTLFDLKKEVPPYSEAWGILDDRGFIFAAVGRVGYVDGDLIEIGRILNPKIIYWKGFDLKEVFRTLHLHEPEVKWDGQLVAYVIHPGKAEDFFDTYLRYGGEQVPDLLSPQLLLSCHLRLEKVLQENLEQVGGQEIWEKLEKPMVPVLLAMEQYGIGLDIEELHRQGKILAQDIARIEGEIHQEAGVQFNVASPKQLGEILFGRLKIPAGKKGKAGYSTASDVLEKLVPHYPICGLVLEYRELAKLKSTYVDALPLLVNKDTSRLHTYYRQAATTTGRLSSVNPNLQNIPIRTERGRMVRKAFSADKEKLFISADYSQIELRVIAHITRDEGLIKAFKEDLDIHTATASEIFEVSLEKVTSDFRRKAKAVNFGIAYGQGIYGLSESLGISRAEAGTIIKRYFERFPRVKDFMTVTIENAKKKGFVETLFGRRRYIEELRSTRPAIRAFGERAAINAPIQGTASDLMKMAMIKVHEEMDIPLVLQVHDELVFESPKQEIERKAQEIKLIMESIIQLNVPLKVNVAWGKNWEDAHA